MLHAGRGTAVPVSGVPELDGRAPCHHMCGDLQATALREELADLALCGIMLV